MYIDIQARDFTLTGSILSEVKRRISEPLKKRYDKIKRITVRLKDINGPRGGNDKVCRVTVMIPGESDVFVEDVKSDLYAAISRAGDRVTHSVSRRFKKRDQKKNRSSLRDRVWQTQDDQQLHGYGVE